MKKIAILMMAFLPLTSGVQARMVSDCAEHEVTTTDVETGFMPVEYDGFWFEVPEGSIVTEENSKVIKYPDGTFGVSATTIRERGSNQKRALSICRGIAGEMKIAHPKIEKFSKNGLKGATATGELEGQTVTIAVIPVNDKELTTVIIATPGRTDWTEHLLSTLKKK